ncbi:hypothetical protein PAAG_08190 [Paracoccidioides lutzii Pb01]|uniref:Uncharacterized protein n=1 Tax=Paracoccidioides lutzii (strain ATCC MYA-826 / Pb01) TaxID=502779 RepID=C1HBP9_PARBA|nr:hypothetical protein PAAG_08190 [Paracoccidioides lutzii Pb01]EEH38463.2 hypothetical protein PAAG_08190 [Paracoccidioides lutzii Pb01]
MFKDLAAISDGQPFYHVDIQDVTNGLTTSILRRRLQKGFGDLLLECSVVECPQPTGLDLSQPCPEQNGHVTLFIGGEPKEAFISWLRRMRQCVVREC